MKTILSNKTIDIPEGVKVSVKGRKVTVVGPRGTLSRDFSHLRLDLQLLKEGRQLRAELWFGQRKAIASIRTCTSQITNMITGVTKGYLYKMRMVYAHFPIAVGIEDDGKKVAVRNFLGEKRIREVPMFPGVIVERSADVKDEIVLTGNDLYNVSQSAANIQQVARVTSKDIRKFLDGIYVSHRGLAKEDD
jgi:large subunit ribosomal protein L9e